MTNKPYVLITSARNEEDYIETTIRAVLSQTVLPARWVIVSDGSTDRTEEIVNSYASRHGFIKLLRLARDGRNSFSSKVKAIIAGCEQLKEIDYAFIGNLDADVSFDSEYYEKILARFQENPGLGIAGGIILELVNSRYIRQNLSRNSVAGAIQMFRRRCFEKIGGYVPLELGGEDAVMEVLARKYYWKVQTFPELKVFHHRRVATGKNRSMLAAKFREGRRDYLLGYHPLFYAAVCIYRAIDRPYLLGGVLRMCGYCWSILMREKRPVSVDFIKYLRREQMSRLKSLFLPINGAKLIRTTRIVSSSS
jgi:glycosyltransferase involved in cell wall biosynthesis